MPARKSLRRKINVHLRMDEELFYFFKHQYISPTEGRMKRGFSGFIERLLRQEQVRLLELAAQGAPDGGRRTTGHTQDGPQQLDGLRSEDFDGDGGDDDNEEDRPARATG